jgi:hypothetical protein
MTFRDSHSFKAMALVVAVFTVLSTAPVSAAELAAPAAVVGSVSSVGTVQLRGVRIAQDATLFAGDTVRSSDGYAKLSLTAGHRVELGPNSQIIVNDGALAPQIALASGSVAFTASGSSALRMNVDPFLVTMTDAGSGLLSLNGTDALGVRAEKGAVRVENTLSKESFMIYPGQARLFGRSSGEVAQSLGDIASTLPTPLPAAGAPMPAPLPQAGSGMSNGAWIAIVAAVGGGVGLGAFFAGRAGQVDEDDLNAANSSLASANADLAAANASVTSLNGQISTLQSDVAARDAQIASLEASNSTATLNLQNQLIGVQNAAALEINSLQTQLAAAEVEVSAAYVQAAIAASGVGSSAALSAQADVITAEVIQLQTEITTISANISDVKAQIAALPTSSITADPTVSGVTAPPGAGPQTLALYAQLTALEDDLTAARISVNAAIVSMTNLIADATAAGVTDIPTLTVTAVGDPVIIAPVAVASASVPS